MSERGPHELGRIEGEAGAEAGASSKLGIGADQALAGLPVSGPGLRSGLSRFRLSPLAAGAVRAAIDCLSGGTPPRTLRVMADEAVLELRCDGIDLDGLSPAGSVIETVGGNLGPASGEPGVWSLRVPVLAPRDTFLMFEQGSLALALPWHAVVRVRLASPDALSALAGQEGAHLLHPLSEARARRGEGALDERPALLIGHGLKRAYVIADRLVWRMPASPAEEAGPAPHPDLGVALETSEGRRFWTLEAATALRSVPSPLSPQAPGPATGVGPAPASPPAHETTSVARVADGTIATATVADEPTIAGPDPTDTIASAPRIGRPLRTPSIRTPKLTLIELTASEVTPIGARGTALFDAVEDALTSVLGPPPAAPGAVADRPVVIVRAVTVAPETPPIRGTGAVGAAPQIPAQAPVALRALVAEDSITARIFLERLLQQRGFAVRSVTTSRALRALAASERWDLVLADVELPDARGARALEGLIAQRSDGVPAPQVALVRDAEDLAHAHAVGVRHTLFKPFERDLLDRLLTQLGLPADSTRLPG